MLEATVPSPHDRPQRQTYYRARGTKERTASRAAHRDHAPQRTRAPRKPAGRTSRRILRHPETGHGAGTGTGTRAAHPRRTSARDRPSQAGDPTFRGNLTPPKPRDLLGAFVAARCHTVFMYFRLTYEVTGYHVDSESTVVFRIGGPRSVSIVLQQLFDESERFYQKRILIRGLAEFEPPPKAGDALRNVARLDDANAPLPDIPGTLQQFSNELYNQLADSIIETFELIRWRLAANGPARPYKSLAFEWSDDQETWHKAPFRRTLQFTASVHHRLSTEVVTELESMALSREQEPLAHALLREALAASESRNWATALVMAMAAIEIGIKQLISQLVPGAAWLAEHLPSPPIDTIIRDYLPMMPARLLINGKSLRVSPRLIKTIKNGSTLRNSTVHAGVRDVKPDSVRKVVAAVGDMLWIFDFYSGHAWALNYLTEETIAELEESEATVGD